ncbi:MAG TPA: insulinase family protein, partial [Polyangiaceae bacterium]|nr:insulinase family protein [Polyangiaceae bacterium]
MVARTSRPVLLLALSGAIALPGIAGAQSPAEATSEPGAAASAAAPAAVESAAAQASESSGESEPRAEGPSAPSTAGSEWLTTPVALDRVSEMTLPNGLRVVMQPVEGATEVSVCTAFEAGLEREPNARAGVTRLLAEILKEGGYRSNQQDYPALVSARGGRSDVRVDYDATVFCTHFPKNELPLALWVTQGRFTTGALTQRELDQTRNGLALAQDASLSDIRTSVAPERLRRMAFLGLDAYARPELPDSSELEARSVAELKELHHSSYVAKQAVVAVSGGFDVERLRTLVEQQLGHVREGEAASSPKAELVAQHTARFSLAEDPSAKQPAAWYGWVVPNT